MQFIDDEDPSDVATGVLTSIVRHKKSKKLTFKYWNHQQLDQEPTNPSDFEYIDLNYAVSNCKWSKNRPTATVFATALLAEEVNAIVVLHVIVSRERSSGCTNEKNIVSHFTQTQHFCSRSSNTQTFMH